MEKILNKYVLEKGISKIILEYKLELEKIKLREKWSLVVGELNDASNWIDNGIRTDIWYGKWRLKGLDILDYIDATSGKY
jgi:hypothetical protein